jgi:UDP-glucose 4-epimerase
LKHVLITGAGGFLGSYMSAACSSVGMAVHGLSRSAAIPPGHFTSFIVDSVENADLDGFLRNNPIHYCFHFASASNVAASVKAPFGDFMNSLPGAARLFDSIRRCCPSCHIVIASSAAVYGNPCMLPVSEDAPIAPISPYGIHKALIENMAQHYSRVYGLRISCLRIFSSYGVGLRKQLLWDACCKAATAAARGEREVEFFGTGQETRDFIHALDVAGSALAVAEAVGEGFCTYNVASACETSVASIVELLLAEFAGKLSAKFNQDERPGDPKRWRADVSKLASLGFVPKAMLTDEVSKYAYWASRVTGLSAG